MHVCWTKHYLPLGPSLPSGQQHRCCCCSCCCCGAMLVLIWSVWLLPHGMHVCRTRPHEPVGSYHGRSVFPSHVSKQVSKLVYLWVPVCKAVHDIDAVHSVEEVNSCLTVCQEGPAGGQGGRREMGCQQVCVCGGGGGVGGGCLGGGGHDRSSTCGE
jgi:hypothetical protein